MSYFRRAAARISGFAGLPVLGFLLASTFAGAALAEVELRLEARPASDPIQAYITVTSAGVPVAGLGAADFAITIDGVPVVIQGSDVTLPPSQDPNQKVSVVFVMDYSQSVVEEHRSQMQDAVIDFIDAMNDGDYAAVVKFNFDNPLGASVVAPFTEIDTVAGNQELVDAVRSDYPGNGTNLLDALEVALNHMLNPPAALPEGPKAIILVSDGADNSSEIEASDSIALANANSIPIFTIGVGDLNQPGAEALLSDLGFQTGGEYFPAPDPGEIADAYATISTRLNNEYLITIPNGISDCAAHEFAVTVTGQAPVDVQFTRRTCDTEPNPFAFTSQTGLDPEEVVVSNTVTITGLEAPAHISVISGAYSIGCTGADTQAPGMINNGDTVCVGQRASAQFSTSKTTTLTIGGVAATFTTTTRAQGGGGGGGGGGGATGLLELMLGLGVLLLGRRRAA
jgi:VWFA-related protein